ncbi:MAG: YhbY family RNA-binding protein [Promethearchaeota archaeon]
MSYREEFKKTILSSPHIILGKKGITNELINHINTLIKRYKILKIKALKSIANKSNIKKIANEISEKTNSYLLDIRGFTFIISKYLIEKKK